MSQQQTILAILERGRGMLRRHLEDFTEAEFLARPVPSADHVAWQLSHLLNGYTMMLALYGAEGKYTVPAKVAEVTKETAKVDDASAFLGKEELLAGNEAAIGVLIDAIKGMTDADLDKPSPEYFHRFATTLGQLALMVPLHQSMHIGQIQVIRRSLGKPVLF
ncbi:MAG: DinB family protein [Tepidisphaeraceae bacterium]